MSVKVSFHQLCLIENSDFNTLPLRLVLKVLKQYLNLSEFHRFLGISNKMKQIPIYNFIPLSIDHF